jgi:DNA-binding response OmpR family regulator
VEQKILLVEDHPDTRDLLALMLRSIGFTVYTADDGFEGLKLVAADCPALIITDLHMPNLDGINMIRILRDQPECKTVPILVVSACESRKISDAITAGANEAICKPIDFDSLERVIARLLDQSKSQDLTAF